MVVVTDTRDRGTLTTAGVGLTVVVAAGPGEGAHGVLVGVNDE